MAIINYDPTIQRRIGKQRIRRAFAQGVSDHQHSFQHFLNTFCFYTCLSFQKSTVHSVVLQQFSSPVSFSHQCWAQSIFFCKNLEQCFNCCSNNCFLSVQCAREAASPGASWPVNRSWFESDGTPFFEACLKPLCLHKNMFFYKKTYSINGSF